MSDVHIKKKKNERFSVPINTWNTDYVVASCYEWMWVPGQPAIIGEKWYAAAVGKVFFSIRKFFAFAEEEVVFVQTN